MPRYLRPNQYGVVYAPTGYIDRSRANGMTQAEKDQQYPCTADGDPLTPEQVAEMMPTPEDVALAEAKALLDTVPQVAQTVSKINTGISSAQSAGVEIDITAGVPGWNEVSEAFAAALDASLTNEKTSEIAAIQSRLDGSWRDLVFHTSDRDAYRLFPYLMQILQG